MLTLETFLARYQKAPIQEYPNQVKENDYLLAVLVTAFNHEKYIAECLDSILNQETDFDFYIFIGEDDSIDATRAICIEYANRYPKKIKLIQHNKENKTYYNGRRTGKFNFMYDMLSIKSEYIAICDGDDYWTDNKKLQKQVDFLGNNTAYTLCFHDVLMKYEKDEASNRCYSADRVLLQESRAIDQLTICRNGNVIPTTSLVFRNSKHLIDDHYVNIAFADLPLILHLLSHGKGYYMHENMGVYRQHNSSLWKAKDRQYILKNTVAAQDVLQEQIALGKQEKRALNKYFSGLRVTLMSRQFSNSKYIDALTTFIKSFAKMRQFFLYALIIRIARYFQKSRLNFRI